MKTPVAYLRKSKVTSDRHVSWETQEAEVRALAARNGDMDLTILSDWNKSGRGSKTHLRTGYAQLRAAIEAGEVSALYSYSLSRLGRSLPELSSLIEQCVQNHIPVRLVRDQVDTSTASGRLSTNMLASVAQFEAEVASERISDSMAARVARGDRLGVAPYGALPGESVEPIIAAFRQAGSCFGAADLLTAEGFKTRRGNNWTGKVIGDVLRRAGVLYHRKPHPGVKERSNWLAYRLIVCPCGHVMTCLDRRSPRLECYRGRNDPGHQERRGISVAKLLPALQAEAAHLRIPMESVEVEVNDETKRSELAAKQARVLDMFADGVIDKAERTLRLAAIGDAMESLDDARRIVTLPPDIDWAWPPEQLNTVLRALWQRVELGADMMPVRFVWNTPEWRAP
jgi:DNA invertase Pin-like site-specific DNA recombinase